jgi:hypothetical protein
MTHTQARRIIGQLAAYFPNLTLDADGVNAWANHLTPHDYTHAQTAVHRLAPTLDRNPYLHDLLEAIRNEEARHHNPHSTDNPPPRNPLPADELSPAIRTHLDALTNHPPQSAKHESQKAVRQARAAKKAAERQKSDVE